MNEMKNADHECSKTIIIILRSYALYVHFCIAPKKLKDRQPCDKDAHLHKDAQIISEQKYHY